MQNKNLFTSESVTNGHPDKLCDQISDGILDAYLKKDPLARVACECAVKNNTVMVFGEITSTAKIDIVNTVREIIAKIGYTSIEYGMDAATCEVNVILDRQSPDIDMGVSKSYENKQDFCNDIQNGAGDQGMMVGYACKETSSLMPAPLFYSHKLAKRLEYVRTHNIIEGLRPDGKTQVTFEYDNEGNPIKIDTVVISAQHDPSWDLNDLKEAISNNVIKPVIGEDLSDIKILVNPTGRFVIGGPTGDSGLTGRKIIVDTYGGICGHGGGAFSGKDPTKVDRSAAYMARYIAKNIVASEIADKCEVELAYAIGVANPVSVHIDTFGTEKVEKQKILDAVLSTFDMRPTSIIKNFDLRKPIFSDLAAYGHMGREDLDVAWEKLDKVNILKEKVFK